MVEIKGARFPDEQDAVADIFREYVRSITVDLYFQDYETEFASLPGKYAAPEGGVLLAWHGSQLIGCAAYRNVDSFTCELKRVYVRSSIRGYGIGRRLVEHAIDAARATGYGRMCLDVLPELLAAQKLYESLGFSDAPPVTVNPVEGTRFLGLDL